MATLTRTMVLATRQRTAVPDTFARGQTRCFFLPLARKGIVWRGRRAIVYRGLRHPRENFRESRRRDAQRLSTLHAHSAGGSCSNEARVRSQRTR